MFTNIVLREEEKNAYSIDPLALGVALKRSKKAYGLKSAESLVLPEDYTLANTIRTHYSKKFFWQALKTPDRVSEFRKKTIDVLSQQGTWNITESEAGIFVKLPYFYEEDMFYDHLKETYVYQRDQYQTQVKHLGDPLRLTFIGSTFKWQKVRCKAFWFTNETNFIYGLVIPENTPFLELFEEKINNPITIENNTSIASIEDMCYNRISNLKFIKEIYAASSPNCH
jgi:hypothetical protein